MTAMYTYAGYKIVSRESGEIAVFDPRFPQESALFKTTSTNLATAWIDAFRAGQHWAVAAQLTPMKAV